MSAAALARETESSSAPPDHASATRADDSVRRLQQQLGNRNIQKLFAGGFTVAPHDHPSEQEARSIARGAAPSTHTSVESHPIGGGTPIDPVLRMILEPRVGRDLRGVRMHHDAAATDALGAHAFTAGSDIVLGTRTPDLKLLAHEAAHAGAASPMIFRDPADDVIAAHPGDAALGSHLAGLARAGGYATVSDVIAHVGYFSRDDVSMAVLAALSIAQLIAIARTEAGRSMLRTLRDEVRSGWTRSEEEGKARLLEAVLGDRAERNIWNEQRIEALEGNDLERLALMFEDAQIVDDGTVSSRLDVILAATEHIVVPGLQTGISFSDTGFRGTRDPAGPGFRDPHPSSRNQPGHFLTAVGLLTHPDVVSRPTLFYGRSVRELVGAPATMSDADVALRLTIGHEKAPDPPGGLEVALSILFAGISESWFTEGPEGETEEERDARIERAIAAETERRIREIIAAFTAQFRATTDADIAAWNETLGRVGMDPAANTAAIEGPDSPLNRITVDPSLRGNSRQDLRLSLMGWRLGQMIRAGDFATNAQVATWIRRNLGP